VRSGGETEGKSELGLVTEEIGVTEGSSEDEILDLDGKTVGLELDGWSCDESLGELVFEVEERNVELDKFDKDVALEELDGDV
jgi:hypothetical protein